MSKLLAILLLPLCCYAQVGVEMPIVFQRASGISCGPSSYTVSSGTLLVQLATCGSTSITNTADSSNLTNWFDLTANGNNFTSSPSIFSGNVRTPVYKTTLGPSGKPAVTFFNSATVQGIWSKNTALLASQPDTVFMVLSISNVNSSGASVQQMWYDTLAGARQFVFIGVNGNTGLWGAGANVTIPVWNNTNWMVHTIVFDGTSSIWRTNGVNFLGGNVGTGAIGQPILGTDRTAVSLANGNLAYFSIYSGHLTTNDMQTIETNLRTQYGF